MPYRVIAPLLIIKDEAGRNHHTYHGGVAHYLNDEQKAHFLRLGLVEEVGVEAKPDPVEHDESKPAPKGKPAKAASEAAWVDYAVSQGFSREEAEAKSKQELIEALG